MAKVTDQGILDQLNAGTGSSEVTDPELLALLNAPIEAQTPQAPQAQPVEAPVAEEPDYFDRLLSIKDKRQAQQTESFDRAFSGESSPAELLLQTAGNAVIGTAVDVIGETVGTAFNQLPDAMTEPVKEFMGDLAGAAMETDTAKWAMEYWGGLDENTQANLAAGGNLLTVLMPKMPKNLFKGKTLQAKGKAIKKQRMSDELKIPETAKTKADDLKGQLRTKEAVSESHRQMTDEVMKIKGISSTNAPNKNAKLIQGQIDAVDAKLSKEIMKNPVDIDGADLLHHLDNSIDEVRLQNDWIGSIASHDKVFTERLAMGERILAKHPKTLEGVRRARKEFDSLTRKSEVPMDMMKTTDAANTAIRNGMNRAQIEAGNKVGIDVAGANLQLHKLFGARDNLILKHGVHKTFGRKAYEQVMRHPVYAGMLLGGSYMLPIPVLGGLGLLGVAKGAKRLAPQALQGAGMALSPTGVGLGAAGALRGAPEAQGEIQ